MTADMQLGSCRGRGSAYTQTRGEGQVDAEGLRFCLTRNPLAQHGCWRGAGSAKSVAKGVVGDTLNEQVE